MKVYMNAIQPFVPPAIVKTFAAFLEFCYIARRNIITEDSLEQLNIALQKFHDARQVFSGTARVAGPSAFSLPRQHAMVHYHDHIKNFGSPNGLCSSITESKHITAVKRPWRRSNKHSPLSQMLRSNERLDKLAAAQADFTARGMLADSCLLQAIKTALDTISCDDGDEDTTENTDSETDSDASSGILDFDTDHTSVHALDTAASNSHGSGPDPDDINTHIPDTDSHPHTPNPPLPTPLDNEDDDCGPVESGPLMNEVRFSGKKGQFTPPTQIKWC